MYTLPLIISILTSQQNPTLSGPIVWAFPKKCDLDRAEPLTRLSSKYDPDIWVTRQGDYFKKIGPISVLVSKNLPEFVRLRNRTDLIIELYQKGAKSGAIPFAILSRNAQSELTNSFLDYGRIEDKDLKIYSSGVIRIEPENIVTIRSQGNKKIDLVDFGVPKQFRIEDIETVEKGQSRKKAREDRNMKDLLFQVSSPLFDYAKVVASSNFGGYFANFDSSFNRVGIGMNYQKSEGEVALGNVLKIVRDIELDAARKKINNLVPMLKAQDPVGMENIERNSANDDEMKRYKNSLQLSLESSGIRGEELAQTVEGISFVERKIRFSIHVVYRIKTQTPVRVSYGITF